jgi:hypothetical protein
MRRKLKVNDHGSKLTSALNITYDTSFVCDVSRLRLMTNEEFSLDWRRGKVASSAKHSADLLNAW